MNQDKSDFQGCYIYQNGQIQNHPEYTDKNILPLNLIEASAKGLLIKGVKTKFQIHKPHSKSYKYFYAILNNDEIYHVRFVPNNYWAMKKLIKYSWAGFPVHNVDFEKRKMYFGNFQESKVKYKFDDAAQKIIINDVAHNFKFTPERVHLVSDQGEKADFMFYLTKRSMYQYAR